ncbi:DNA alkylation repair protein [Reichenbachiella versicolor]|uniref:DNA alkylation repair protein n=1 Tax=Reichenbachiella versicolor TaxID=1821036 RepID=UPI000D6E94D2|nr:DNA alkylation repair protein [Reichenbachiella versicolor]
MIDSTLKSLHDLLLVFEQNADTEIARQQKAYMKGRFEYFGIKAPDRKQLQKPFLVKAFLPRKNELQDIVEWLWGQEQREFQMYGQELVQKFVKDFERNDIKLMEYMVVTKSWWDSVDFIASNLIGEYFKKFPEAKDFNIDRWLKSDNIWLQRVCLIFQLKYGSDTDVMTLIKAIDFLNGTNEFFINKAIGWALRQYGKVDPDWVVDFVDNTELSQLSRKEALKLISQACG